MHDRVQQAAYSLLFAAAIESEAQTVLGRFAGTEVETLAETPEPHSEEVRACIKLLSLLGPPSYLFDSQLFAFVVTRTTNLSLTHGPSLYSAFGYTLYVALHNQRTGDYETGFALGRLALALARRFGNGGESGRGLYMAAHDLATLPRKTVDRCEPVIAKAGSRVTVEATIPLTCQLERGRRIAQLTVQGLIAPRDSAVAQVGPDHAGRGCGRLNLGSLV